MASRAASVRRWPARTQTVPCSSRTAAMGTSTPCSLMLAKNSASRSATSRTLSSSVRLRGSRCSRVPMGWLAPAASVIGVVSVMTEPFCVKGRLPRVRLLCLPSGTEDLGRYQGCGAQGPGATVLRASARTQNRREPCARSEAKAAALHAADRRPQSKARRQTKKRLGPSGAQAICSFSSNMAEFPSS